MLLLLSPVWIPLILFAILIALLRRLHLYVGVHCVWMLRGKNVLFVTSNSPIWHDYMETAVLPFCADRAVVLNWSERATWPKRKFAVSVFRSFGGHREFNPLVIVFQPFRRARIFRYYGPFRQFKNGMPYAVEELTRQLRALL